MNKATIIAAFLLLLSGIPTVAQGRLPSMKVVSVGDGDTLRVRNQQGQPVTIRLGCVDAPELKQNPWGQQSKTRLQELLPVGQSVQVRSIERDRYKRLVAEVFVNNRSVNDDGARGTGRSLQAVSPRMLGGYAIAPTRIFAFHRICLI
jgi:micrococcal nuclease